VIARKNIMGLRGKSLGKIFEDWWPVKGREHTVREGFRKEIYSVRIQAWYCTTRHRPELVECYSVNCILGEVVLAVRFRFMMC